MRARTLRAELCILELTEKTTLDMLKYLIFC